RSFRAAPRRALPDCAEALPADLLGDLVVISVPLSAIVDASGHLMDDPIRIPPSTSSTTPVMYLASSEHRNAAAAAMSLGSPVCRSGTFATCLSRPPPAIAA